jgi:hypothetical protein
VKEAAAPIDAPVGAGVDLGAGPAGNDPSQLRSPREESLHDTYHGHAGALSRVVTMTRDIMAMHN